MMRNELIQSTIRPITKSPLSVCFLLILLLLTSTVCSAEEPSPYLSSLSATKNSPLYTTYCAAKERSEFTLDEGYHFMFYDSTRGPDFITDNAGDWCLAFKNGANYVYELKDMYKEPVITSSYADLVKYTYHPFEDVKVDVAFVVHSSRAALQDIVIRNVGSQPVKLQVFSFLNNSTRTFENVALHKDKRAITFTHEELPDSWVLEHDVPYISEVQNVFLFSQPPDRLTSFRSHKWGNVEIPQSVDLNREQVFIVWGKLSRKDGERCTEQSAKSKLMVLLNDDKSRILTETAPRWGSSDANVTRYGYYGVELGNFGDIKNGDRFTVMATYGESDSIGMISGSISSLRDTSDTRVDLVIGEALAVKSPEGLRKDVWGSGTEIRLYWKKVSDDVVYNVYRRNYRAGGAYELIAEHLKQAFFTDKNIPGESIYGYVVVTVDPQGRMSIHSDEINNIAGSDFLTDVKYPGQIKSDAVDNVKVVSGSYTIELAPGASAQLRVIRAVGRTSEDQQRLIADAHHLLTVDVDMYVAADEQLYSRIPRIDFKDRDREMLYWSAFTLMQQVMLPPEAKCHYNYYVFSREPQWGWGHGGQVFHESLTILAYAFMDATSAMNSQRVYLDRQHADGYINYRTGPYLDETIPYNNQLTTSAPWYAWQNWEVYKISNDRKFLEEMYQSSKSFYNYYVKNRDGDGDGLCEWGAHAVLESVRDGRVAVWDEVGWPSNFEALDLNSMLVVEAKALAAMASELGYDGEAMAWQRDATTRAKQINETMWDEATGFYYNVDKKNHTFTFKKPNDLKREEIIGFLPLWAGIANEQQAKALVQKLTDPKKFWRKYGVPSLSADDPYYNPKGYWNGPVWVEWNYLIVRGLIDYGFVDEARELTDRVAANMIAQLKKDHNLWEFYSPDDQWSGYHKTYIWAGIINRMFMDLENR
ncbi:MAG: hypothetical protein HY708_04700 [Ignavibacteriae bacterium]|nr:hypothetical protein [Ignavibacteriota bacterium]